VSGAPFRVVSDGAPDEPAGAAAQAAARSSYGRLVAFLSARTHDVAGAEDALAEAFEAALREWPVTGVPQSPQAWLLTVARRKLVDAARRRRSGEAVAATLLVIDGVISEPPADDKLPDDRLALMFACTHPAIEAPARAPLMLQTLLGFDAAAIASAFLVSPATMGQRLVRAKAKIRQAGIPLTVPERAELPERLAAVLAATYAAFSEGWADAAGASVRRRNLVDEGLWLARLLASLLPCEPEALGLLALMLYAQARRPARRDALGDYVPLALQDSRLWDGALLDEAEALLRLAGTLARPGRYQLEAAVQSAHVARRISDRTDWSAIVRLYDALWHLTASPVIAINRAVALAEAVDAAAGLAALDALAAEPRLRDYQPYWAARASLLARTGRVDESREAYRLAIGLETDEAVRRYLQGCLLRL
jgi:RNA polymerase sigma-70 factor, ECF subfamily